MQPWQSGPNSLLKEEKVDRPIYYTDLASDLWFRRKILVENGIHINPKFHVGIYRSAENADQAKTVKQI